MNGFISRWVLHMEWHPGYRPRVSIRRIARHGDQVTDGGQAGHLVGCQVCDTTGFLFVSDQPHPAATPTTGSCAK